MTNDMVAQLLEEGEQFFTSGDVHKALEAFEHALKIDPTQKAAFNNLGVIAFTYDDIKTAESYFKRALTIDENHFDALLNMGKCAEVRKDLKAAIRWYEKAVAVDRRNKELLNLLKGLYVQLEDYGDAERTYNESLCSDSDQEQIETTLSESRDFFGTQKYGAALTAKHRLNIGFISVWYERGQAYVTKTLRDALSENHNTFVLARTGAALPGQPQLVTSGYWNVPNLTTHDVYAIPPEMAEKWISDNDLDVVVFNEEYDWKLVEHCKGTRAAVVTYLDYYGEHWKPHLKLYDGVLCSTLRTFKLVRKFCNAYYIGWGIDTQIFRPLENNGGNHTFFHNAGWHGINYRKMTPAVILAFDAVSRELPDVTLFIHSQASVDKLPSQVVKIVKNNPRITFHVETVPAPGLYHLGKILVFPSKLEGLGLPLLEGMACGLPAIATDAPPMNEFVRHEDNGLVVRVAQSLTRGDGVAFPETIVDVNDLACKMAELAQDPDRIKQMGQSARQSVLDRVSTHANDWRIAEAIHGSITKEKHPYITAGYIAYNEEEFISYSLRSVYEFVDKIVIVWGAYCFGNKYTPRDRTLEIIRNFPDPAGKITIVEGEWESEVEQRNECLKHVSKGYFFMVDGDEIYTQEILDRIRDKIIAHPEVYVFDISSLLFWQDFDTVIEGDHYFHRIFKVVPGCRFTWLNMMSLGKKTYKELNSYVFDKKKIFNYHFSYARSDKAIREKIDAFNNRKDCLTHRATPNWYENVWMGWKRSPEQVLRNFGGTHPVNPSAFSKFRRRVEPLPDVFKISLPSESNAQVFTQGKILKNGLLLDLLNLLGGGPCRSMLDLGCGRGSAVAQDIEMSFKVGIDLSEDALLDSKNHFPVVRMDVKNLSFHDDSFDLVLGMDILEHLSKEDGFRLLASAEKLAEQWIALYIPYNEITSDGFLSQKDNPNWKNIPDVDKNSALMQHLSGWKPEELETFGYRTYVYHNRLGPGRSTFWAVKQVGFKISHKSSLSQRNALITNSAKENYPMRKRTVSSAI